MQVVNAAQKADEFIKLIIQNQPGVLPPNALVSEEQAQRAAQAIAKLRSELIEQLKPQQ